MLDQARHFDPVPTSGKGDRGLRAYMAPVYLRMAGGMAMSAATSWHVAHDASLAGALFTPDGLTTTGWIVTLAPLGLVFLLSARIDHLGAAAGAIFLLYAALVGLSLGGLLFAYTGVSLVATFVATAGGFAALAWFGSMSRRDLSAAGTFLSIGLAGLIVALLLNMFTRSAGFDLVLSAIGLMLFAGLAAVDAQRLKRLYRQAAGEGREQLAILGALTLYLDFLNLFVFLLRFTGRRRD
ncbi:Bax inhibitor-1/YccA family protein [Sphingomonas sp. RT2P30]|uniref:Bax inhibitor-1/YccA family protein n=1 Tax=Parasphingomonas halimpatiens TaxID=3096162 RepID=UPI002FCAAFE7